MRACPIMFLGFCVVFVMCGGVIVLLILLPEMIPYNT